MPSPPPKKEYVRLTLGQKAMLCKMASMRGFNSIKAMRWAKLAWDNVKPESIRNCWSHSGIVERPSSKMAMRRILSY
ncbi:hypothetical protein JG688_00017337 [Phytophthora aleatoria]|uniref:DDE-1 domain-containing protein n=1 Tax=Phytophthora aleatoria TaxID=2496075 RepID=A0A8J5IE12_9STRA|nr:hypothetical protein JG688_00017337 [Phytophthora aleatoria]